MRRTRRFLAFTALFVLAACSSDTTPPTAITPSTPTNVQAVVVKDGIEVTWTDTSDNENGFLIYREDQPQLQTQALEEIGEVRPNITTYLDTTVEPGVPYVYSVRAFNAQGSSSRGSQAGGPVEYAPPSGSLTVELLGSGTGSVASTPSGIDCGTTCTADFETGTSVILTATAASGSVFAGWDGECSGGDATCTVTIDDDVDVQARFSREYALDVSTTGDGSGTVTSDPAGIACGATCSAAFADGIEVVLTAAPEVESTFEGWTGACSGTSLTCTVAMDAAKTVSAAFAVRPPPEPDMVRLTVLTTGNGAVISTPAGIDCGATCVADFADGSTVTLKATPGTDAAFENWGGACSGSSTSCTLTLEQDATVSANFSGLAILTVEKSGTGSGIVVSSPVGIDCGTDCSEGYITGTGVTLKATPESGTTFAGWSGAGCGENRECSITMNQDASVIARFEQLRPLSVSVSGPGSVTSDDGQIDCEEGGGACNAEFVVGESVTLTASPDQYAEFVNWGGACSGTSPTCTFEVNSSTSVTATFTATAIVVTTDSGGVGQNECTLRDAIRAANTDAPSGACPAGDGTDRVVLPADATINLLSVDNTTNGANGLPSVYTDVSIVGNNSTIKRSSAATTAFRIFHVGLQGNLTLSDMMIAGGLDDLRERDIESDVGAGGIYSRGDLTLDGVTIANNESIHPSYDNYEIFASAMDLAGALFSESGDVAILRSKISSNISRCGDYCTAGVVFKVGNLEIRDSEISQNEVNAWSGDTDSGSTGGGLKLENANAFIASSTFSQNDAAGYYGTGGAIAVRGSTVLEINDSTFSGNSAEWGSTFHVGGAAVVTLRNSEVAEPQWSSPIRNLGSLKIFGSTIAGNGGGTTSLGGALDNLSYNGGHGVAVLSNTTISGCGEEAGAIYNEGRIEFINGSQASTNCDNNAPQGVVTNVVQDYENAFFLCENSRISGGTAPGNGGGVRNSATFKADDCTIENNKALGNGGGIYSTGSLEVLNSIIRGNTADAYDNDTGVGGGIFHKGDGTFVIQDTQIGGTGSGDRNYARNGGGLFLRGDYHQLQGVSIIGNEADGNGGGIFIDIENDDDAENDLYLYGVEMTGNTANIDGGAIYLKTGKVSLRDSSITENIADVNTNGTGRGGGIYRASEGFYEFVNTTIEGNEPDDIYSGPHLEALGSFGLYALSPDAAWSAGTITNSLGIEQAILWARYDRLEGLGDLPGGEQNSKGEALSSDGSVVVGSSTSGNGREAFRWTSNDGLERLGDLAGGMFQSSAYGVSGDGSVIVGGGRSSDGPEAFRWTRSTGMIGLGDFPGGGFDSIATGVSADGTVIIGRGESADGELAFRWTQIDGLVALGDLPGGGTYSSATAISEDGSTVVGRSDAGSVLTAFRWTQATGMQPLGKLGCGDFEQSTPYALSKDGNFVVGAIYCDTGDTNRAVIWDATGTPRELESILAGQEVDVAGWNLQVARDTSSDGRVIIGGGTKPDGEPVAIMMVIDHDW